MVYFDETFKRIVGQLKSKYALCSIQMQLKRCGMCWMSGKDQLANKYLEKTSSSRGIFKL